MMSGMTIQNLSVGPFEVNCAIVWNDQNQALVIDPGGDAADIDGLLQQHSLSVAAFLLTHGHADHLGALAELHAARPAPVYLHAADFQWAFGAQNQIPPYYPVPKKPPAVFIRPEETSLPGITGFSLQVLETPGHTPGGVCYWFPAEKILFTGDSLFKGSCGRTDLPGGDGRILAQSLKKLAGLPGETLVYPGHNESTSIGHEKKTNFFMQKA
jgi:hydroxyacylglutathione hydrolase